MCPIKSLTVIQMIIIIMLYFKELYKLGKKKKAHRTCLYAILNRGYQISSFEYHICYVTTRCQDQCLGYQLLEEFEKECVNFATAAEAFGKQSIILFFFEKLFDRDPERS